MSTTVTPAAKPKFWTRRRIAAWVVIAALLATCASAARDRLRTARTVAVIERVDRLGGHVALRREHADWQWWLVRRVPALGTVLGRDEAKVGLCKAAPSLDDLRAVIDVLNVRELDLTDAAGIDDRALEVIGGVEGLINLDLTGTGVTDAGIERLPRLPKLNAITLDDTKVTDATVAALTQRRKVVKAISVRGANVTDVVGEGIAVSQPVRSGGPITVAGRVFIRELPPGGRIVLTADFLRPGRRDGPGLGRMPLTPNAGWQNFTLAATVPVREPGGRFAVEVNVYVGGPPFVIYRVARFDVDVLPAATAPATKE